MVIISNITVVDSIMGAGKTSWSIQCMNKSDDKFVYITPFLKEVQRIKDTCKDRRFYEPTNKGKGKLDELHNLLSKGCNITSTHALFRTSNNVTKNLIKSHDYILILDEVMDVVEKLDLQKDDINTLLNEKLAHIENDFLIWDKEEYNGRYNDIKAMSENKSIIIINDKALFWNFPVEIFDCFKEVYIMTYIFDAQIQKYYYDFHNVEYNYKSVYSKDGEYYLDDPNPEYEASIVTQLKDKINILENDKLNNIGDPYYALSSSWFKKEDNEPLIPILKNNILNYFNNRNKCKTNQKLWTSFKIAKSKLKGKGYTKGFTSINLRATNEYSDRNVLAYCCNIFLHPDIEHFFIKRDIKVDENKYALSEMLQWIWRSSIRNNEDINIYIPSRRQRELLIEWLDK